ncbi:MAG TPA: HAD family hydrolase [Clostridia bacterium]|nr:HAD family hydrolase [Clostridia bacterium]
MLIYDIPGRGIIEIKQVVFDYNGTLAVDGKLIDGAGELLAELRKLVDVYILTADTYGTVTRECASLGVEVLTFPREKAGEAKKEIVERLGAGQTLCVGNGFNDIEMCRIAALSIAVVEKEGCCGRLLSQVDIVAPSMVDALAIILKPNRVKATLRN